MAWALVTSVCYQVCQYLFLAVWLLHHAIFMTREEYLYHASVMHRIYLKHFRIYIISFIILILLCAFLSNNWWLLLGIPICFLGMFMSYYLIAITVMMITIILILTHFNGWGYYTFFWSILITSKYLFDIAFTYKMRAEEFRQKAEET